MLLQPLEFETMNRIFSGVQPTGNLHLGNYLGAIRNWVDLQESYDCLYCVVDLHAITVFQSPEELRRNTLEVTASLLAAGINPDSSILFNQSQVPAHSELAWLFNCTARLGWLNRMTQFKEKAGKNREKASVGLYAYPTLMAADILAYHATHVPVGDDQKQHLELVRDIAQSFNSSYGVDFFPLVEPLILGAATRVMSLRDGNQKMSKSEPSDNSRINFNDSRDNIARKIRKAKTDSHPLPGLPSELETRPEAANLIGIFASLSRLSVAEVCQQFEGKSFLVFKEALTELALRELTPITARMCQLMEDTDHVEMVLKNGAEKASAMAAPILRDVQHIIGFVGSFDS